MALATLSSSVAATQTIRQKLFFQVKAKLCTSTACAGLGVSVVAMEGRMFLVWRDMNSAWGEDARLVIAGSSVHNQSIERHNRSANEQELFSSRNFVTSRGRVF